jgi:hypothetical protein
MQTEMMKLRELTVRYTTRKDHDGRPVAIGRGLDTPKASAAALMALLRDESSEVLAYYVSRRSSA